MLSRQINETLDLRRVYCPLERQETLESALLEVIEQLPLLTHLSLFWTSARIFEALEERDATAAFELLPLLVCLVGEIEVEPDATAVAAVHGLVTARNGGRAEEPAMPFHLKLACALSSQVLVDLYRQHPYSIGTEPWCDGFCDMETSTW